MVTPVPMVSSSGWAWTSTMRRSAVIGTGVVGAALNDCSLMTATLRAGADIGETVRMTDAPADSFPRRYARTQRFTLGQPRAFSISHDGDRVLFLRSKAGDDAVTCLWRLDVADGEER